MKMDRVKENSTFLVFRTPGVRVEERHRHEAHHLFSQPLQQNKKKP